jgi:hypothetical protein
MARKAENEEVLVGVIATPQDRAAVVHLQLPLLARDATYLAASAALRDQVEAPRRREFHRTRPQVVGGSEPLA